MKQHHTINRTSVTLMMNAGMDSAITDPMDKNNMAIINTLYMLSGNDQFCIASLLSVV